jgi:hypothetical protein
MDGMAFRQISRSFFSLDTPESLAQRWFHKNVSRKILFSKNLNTKILGTNGLGWGTLGSPNRHCLDDDRSFELWAQG